jgi:uncharacterized membrane protein
MIYLDILLLIVSYILGSLIMIMDGSIQPLFNKYGVTKVVVGRVIATLALNAPVMVYFPSVYAVIALTAVAVQVYRYIELKKTYSEWSNL